MTSSPGPSFEELFGSAPSPLEEKSTPEHGNQTTVEVDSRNIDPVAAAEDISADYRRYLKTMLRPSAPAIATAFSSAVDTAVNLTKGPILQLTPHYAPGHTPEELISAGVLGPSFAELAPNFNLGRPLYQHQESALRKIRDGRNLIVSTGTGSGKTESFLIPIIDELLRQKAAGTLGPGVRALLLYPMNALANDQVQRLRDLLSATPEITFGRYTGETKQTRADALATYREMNGPHSEPLPNELLSRDEMQEAPPHLLLTNYAMLEYLLLRPRDHALFDGEHAQDWRYLVMDEAHVYAGAQGTEVGMLLRRLKDRVTSGRALQCIATSASLEGDSTQIVQFGEDIFGEPFEYDATDEARQDLVRATTLARPRTATWKLDPTLFDGELESEDLPAALAEETARRQADGSEVNDYAVLSQEHHVVALRELVSVRSMPLAEVGEHLWPEASVTQAMHRAHQLVLLASGVVSATGVPVFSARYHMFVRAAEGAYLSFAADGRPEVTLDRHVTAGAEHRPVYEMGTCTKCGAVHIHGVPSDDGFLIPPDKGLSESTPRWVVLTDQAETARPDEDDLDEPIAENDSLPLLWSLCFSCGKLLPDGATSCPHSSCSGGVIHSVRILPRPTGSQTTCTVCGGRRQDLIRRLLTDANAAPAVLTTSLYQLLPEADEENIARKVGAGRKLLTFSDSRQAAAYAAPYLETSYGRLLERRILVETLTDDEFAEGASIERWITRAGQVAQQHGVLRDRMNSRERLEEVGPWVYADLASVTRQLTTEGLGLSRVELTEAAFDQMTWLPRLSSLFQNEQKAKDLINILVQDVRHKGAVVVPDYVDMNDERFEPRTGQQTFRYDGGRDNRLRVYSWVPQKGTNNRRELLGKILRQIGMRDEDDTRVDILLQVLWEDLTGSQILRKGGSKATGVALDTRYLQVTPGKKHTWYECDTCRVVTAFNVLDLCPNGWCPGTLNATDPDSPRYHDDHYRTLAQEMSILPLSAKEHTAQWTPTEAAEVQKEFIDGDVNVLSCSTTFELGVDVGDLQSVMMRNVPPRTANYVQRAGRAGRRTGSAAFVLTFAKRGAHDMSVFQDPVKMIDGEMSAPIIRVDNVRIAERHAYSVAFAEFLRVQAEQGNEWSQVGDFFLPTPDAELGLPLLREFLNPVPEKITEALHRVMPLDLHRALDLDTAGWATRYLDLFDTVAAEVTDDYEVLSTMQKEALAKESGRQADAYKYTIRTLRTEQLIGYLAKKNLLPKYGFPVDTVELQTNFSEGGNQVNLSRDLLLAISDYAPGAQVVAGGRIWESAGIRELPGKKLPTRYWVVCGNCDHVETSLQEFTMDDSCTQCSSKLPVASTKKFIIPQYGFVAKHNPSPVRLTPPRRAWHRREFVQKFGDEIAADTYESLPPEVPARVITRAWARTDMGALDTGDKHDRGYWYCERCGFASASHARPKTHIHPRTQRECQSWLDLRALGHSYQTDIATIAAPTFSRMDFSDWRSALYALIEAAADTLEINRDDLNGTMATYSGQATMVLYDTVPGGAGISKKVRERFPEVLEAALERVSDCECGADTSCYACLRSYGNQRFHEELRRDEAKTLLSHMWEAVQYERSQPR